MPEANEEQRPADQNPASGSEGSAPEASPSAPAPSAPISPAPEPPGPSRRPRRMIVRYGYLGFVGEFEYDGDDWLSPQKAVLVETDRGLELGYFVGYIDSEKGAFVLNPRDVQKYLKNSGDDYLRSRTGKVLRAATAQDLREQEHIKADTRSKMNYCQQSAEQLNLRMKIVCVEHLFGGERIIFYFTADGRVDFRELVRDLAREYQTRIELRQIGARDEARLLADYEICGRQCCCKNFLKILRPVNMKMAKLQKATLDPSKVSGRCGRLRCCLAYEHKCYEELASQLPRIGSWVQTTAGVGRVRDRQILTQLVQVSLSDGRLVAFPADEVSPSRPPSHRPEEPVVEEEAGDPSEAAADGPDEGELGSLSEVSDRQGDGTSSEQDPSKARRGRRGRRRRR